MHSKYLREHEYFFKHTHRGGISVLRANIPKSQDIFRLQFPLSKLWEVTSQKGEICEIYNTENAPFLASISKVWLVNSENFDSYLVSVTIYSENVDSLFRRFNLSLLKISTHYFVGLNYHFWKFRLIIS